jgi:hypothetical protein
MADPVDFAGTDRKTGTQTHNESLRCCLERGDVDGYCQAFGQP